MIKFMHKGSLILPKLYKQLALVQRERNSLQLQIAKLQQELVYCTEREAQIADKISEQLEKEAEVLIQ